MPKKKNSYDLYNDLINLQNDEDFSGLMNYGRNSRFDENDSESFIFEAEIKEKEKELGIKRPGSTHKNSVEVEENFHFKRFNKRRVHKYTETEMKQIREECMEVIVHDYGDNDWYHIPDEEREKLDELKEMSVELAGIRGTYTKVDQYIEAMRVVYKAWTLISNSNYLHTRDEFFKLIAKGQIVSPRIPDIKLRKMDRYNIDLLIHYISNPELDTSHLVPKKVNEDDENRWLWDPDAETESQQMKRVLSEEEAEYVNSRQDEKGEDIPEMIDIISVKNIKPRYIKGYDKRNISRKKRKGNKKERYMREQLALMLNKIQNSNFYKEQQGHSWMITNNLFEQKKSDPNVYEEHPFDGSWSDEEAVAIYDLFIQESMMNEIPPWEKYKTYGELELQKFFKTLEENGLNVTELRKRMGQTDNATSKKITAKERKENKRKEGIIVQRLEKLNRGDKFKKLIQKAEKAANEGSES